ncbi:hypothetical protein APR12_004681 [Nocardia amikacinitolerans]|uniref:hypothetical protein n=1 Tax=Nocardia amikacinitolerans TaxID=756689 RepID=UPI0008379C29|nr:hypothetical protein [Nocardia amikacinitolerans]MCP2319314.1 hypothetical protein [Nocardia amikacinitolerans]
MSDFALLLAVLADLFMLTAGFYYGIKFLRGRPNFLLALEWLVIGVSGANVVVLAATGVSHSSLSYHLMVFFDAFSRSFGMTLLIVIGMLAVTHRYRPSWLVEAAAIAAGVAVGLNRALDPRPVESGWAIFYLVVNLAVALFMFSVAARLWRIGDRRNAAWVSVATALGAFVAVIYDYFPIPGDDADHTLFYILAMSVWGLMLVTYYHGYRALEASQRGAAAAKFGTLSPQ